MELSELLELGDRGVQAALDAGASQAEMAMTWQRGASVELEKNDLSIAMSDEELTFGLRVVAHGRQGFATSNDPKTLEATAIDALAIAATSPEDPHSDLPAPRPVSYVADLYDGRLIDLGTAEITDLAADLLAEARRIDARASIDSGSVDAGFVHRAICSSRGVRVAETSSHLSGSLFGMAVADGKPGSFVTAAFGQRQRDGIETALQSVARDFTEKAVGALNPGRGRSYRGAVLFTPEATASVVLGNLLGMLDSSVIRKGKSPFAGKLGQRIASPGFEIVDRPTEAGAYGASSFDREGLPRGAFQLVADGVLVAIPFNHHEALAARRPEGSTGHASGGSEQSPGVGVSRPVLAPGTKSVQALTADAGEIVVVTRFSGSTDRVTGDFSGVVKAGHLQNAEGARRPVSEVLISGNLLDLFQAVIGTSSEIELIHGRLPCPWLLADGISVTAG